ncbi:cytoplasmic tRNA 2-thiolation protein 2-A-like [Ylistrum balloti]|uniref:cytoplasmic tRNA 2-thiolation protein 2-A-like n=1 Tax=Ylistrum balloti TaxID=509963 RepID=UPI0029059C89|nr:cytoplasmic tRNA 2-thiolation protein 2-A-like [Ylistrum balloti]
MCSVQEGDSDGPIQKERISPGRKCMKCHTENAILITRVNDAFCKACFMVYVTHKFRATIGKSKLVRDGEKVLVAYSGGPSSSCLLHLITEGLSQRAHKKLRFTPGIVFIDESAVLDNLVQDGVADKERIAELMENVGYPCHTRYLEEALCLDQDGLLPKADLSSLTEADQSSFCTAAIHSNSLDRARTEIKSLFSSIKSLTAREDMLNKLRQRLLMEVAKVQGYSKVMTGHCGTRLAVNLLSDISQGRGSHVAMDTAFSDTRYPDIMFVRPIRGFSSKEVAMYNALHGVESVFLPTLTTKTHEGSSIEHLTEAFVTGLQADYPSTISNIMRTGEKLSTEKKEGENCHCALCQGPLDTDVGPSSALSAVEFSSLISQKKKKNSTTCGEKDTCCGEGDGSCHTKNEGLKRDEVMSVLCYGCRMTVKDMADPTSLPEKLTSQISYRIRRSKMKNDIQDFLLDPENS